MVGNAQALFMERQGRAPWSAHKELKQAIWNRMVSCGIISYLDVALAEGILRGKDKSDALMALLCHLSAAARQGHLCIRVAGDIPIPLPKECSDPNSECTATPEELNQWTLLIIEGFHQLPNELVEPVQGPLHRRGESLYLQRFWIEEERFTHHLRRLVSALPTLQVDSHLVNQELDRLLNSSKLLPEQAEAIRKACGSCVTIISGGPGTGKTYTAAQLLRVFWQSLPEDDRARCQIALAAPTGKAAAILEASIAKAFDVGNNLKARTLHSLLGMRRNGEIDPHVALTCDLLLVDESSMLDAKLMTQLFASMKSGARLVLLGDKDQLPSVEAGAFFADLLSNQLCSSVMLRTCLRTDSKEMAELASAVNEGDVERVMRSFEQGIKRVDLSHSTLLRQKFLTQVLDAFEMGSDGLLTPSDLLLALRRFRVLGSLRKGFWGVDTLNTLLAQQSWERHRNVDSYTIPIMVIENDYGSELFNGEVGVLMHKAGRPSYALFVSSDGKEVRRIVMEALPRFEHAYCISVHKSQGSEFDHVLLLLPEGSEVFGREVLYTAVTRSRHDLEVWATENMLRQIVSRRSQRLSGLR